MNASTLLGSTAVSASSKVGVDVVMEWRKWETPGEPGGVLLLLLPRACRDRRTAAGIRLV